MKNLENAAVARVEEQEVKNNLIVNQFAVHFDLWPTSVCHPGLQRQIAWSQGDPQWVVRQDILVINGVPALVPESNIRSGYASHRLVPECHCEPPV